MKKVMTLRLLWGTLFFSLISPAPVLSMMSQNIPHIKLQEKKEPTSNEMLLRHVAVIRDLKKRILEKEDEDFDRKWDKYFEGKSLDDLRGDLEKTVTGRILINLSLKELDQPKTLDEVLEEHLINVKNQPFVSPVTNLEELKKMARTWIENEIKFGDEYYVFYSSLKGSVKLLFDAMSEFSGYFSIDPFHDLLKLRIVGLDKQKYFNSMDNYIRKFEEEGGTDHSQFARQTQVSARLSFLADPVDWSESSLGFFIRNENQSDPSKEILYILLNKFLNSVDAHNRVGEYLKLLGNTGVYQAASMMQIFIKKNEANSLVYPAVPMGRPIGSPIPLSNCISIYLETPLNELHPLFDPYHSMQARILMNMEKFLDPNIVKIKIFGGGNIFNNLPKPTLSGKNILDIKSLPQLVQEDLLYYLEYASKGEREQNKLESLEVIMKAGEEVERHFSSTESSEMYEDPEFQGLGRVVPNAWKPSLELIRMLENITWVEDKKIEGKWIEAPFTARDVVEHVKGSTIIYKIEFLKTNEGLQLIAEIINKLNEHLIPKDADFSLYDRQNPEAGINKLLIATYAAGLKAISDSKK